MRAVYASMATVVFMTFSTTTEPSDVLIVGGSAAGLSAALALGRSRRSVVVIDAGRPRNATSAHMHGVLGQDGLSPAEFLARGRRDLEPYDVTLVEGTATGATRLEDGTFEVALQDGRTYAARALLAATGVRDELPDIPGLWERWEKTCCTAPTVMDGRSATSRSRCSRPPRCRRTPR